MKKYAGVKKLLVKEEELYSMVKQLLPAKKVLTIIRSLF